MTGTSPCASVSDARVWQFAFLPRASVLMGPWNGFSFSLNYGQGARSIDPIFVGQDLKTPFAMVNAYEGGALYAARTAGLDTIR